MMKMKKKILAVDNNPVILKLLSNFLEGEGHQVITAQDGIFAIDVLRTFVPDIMFVDQIMPNLNGDKLCQIIRSNPNNKNIFIIIFSGIAVEDDLGIDFTNSGADACLAKGPFDSLKSDIRELIVQADEVKEREDHKKVIGVERLYKREITRELLDIKKHADVMRDNISDAVFEITSDGVVVYVNQKAVQLIGEQESQLLARDFFGLFQGKYVPQIKKSFELAVAEKCVEKNCLSVGLNNREVSLQFIPIESEVILSIMVIVHDISKSRKEMMVQKNAREFAEARCSFLNQYLGGVSRAIEMVGNDLADMLSITASNGALDSEQSELSKQINSVEVRLRDISRELVCSAGLKLAPQEHKLSVFDLHKSFADGMAVLKEKTAKKKISLTIDLPDLKGAELVGTSEGLLLAASGLVDLLLNVSEMGELSIQCELSEEPSRGSVKLLFAIHHSESQFPVFSKSIFDFLLPANISCGRYLQNLGEDLTHILHEIRNMNGKLWVEEISGKGPVIFFTACFDISSMAPKFRTSERIFDRSLPICSKKLTVLFVDDDLFTNEFLVSTVEQLTDWNAVTIDEFAMLQSTVADTDFDLAIVNVDMVRADVIEVCSKIKSKLRSADLPIIALAENSQEEQELLLEAGFDDCISKPVDIDDFFAVAEKFL